MSCRNVFLVGRDIAVGTATRYGLHGPGIESRSWRDFFQTCPEQQWVPRLSRGGKAAGA
jgi:hypothetical protein